MNVDARHLRAFVSVAQEESFVRAAAVLRVSQPTLSQRIKQVEDELGVRLFERTSRSVHLTPVGRSFLPEALRLIADLESVLEQVRRDGQRHRGTVVVSGLPSVATHVLHPALLTCREQYPDITVQIDDDNAKGVIHRFGDGAAELGFCSLMNDTDGLVHQRFARDRLAIVCRRSHPFAAQIEVSWEEVCREFFIGMSMDTGIRRLVDQALAQRGLKLDPLCEVSHLGTLIGMVESGAGVTVLPGLALPKEHDPQLISKPLRDPTITRELCVLARGQDDLSAAACGFLSAVDAVLKDKPSTASNLVDWLPPPSLATGMKRHARSAES